jgi:hypothetical protein
MMIAGLLILAATQQPGNPPVPVEQVLRVLCPSWPRALPHQIERASLRARAPSDLVAATVGKESTCDNHKTSRLGAVGYGQLLPGGSAAKHHTAKQLRRVGLNLRLTAEHLAKGLRLCHGSRSQAVAFYSAVWPCQETEWSKGVVGAIEKARSRVLAVADGR